MPSGGLGQIVETKDDPYFGGFRWLTFWPMDSSKHEMRYAAVDKAGVVETGSGHAGHGDRYDVRGQVSGGKSLVKQSWRKVSDHEFQWSGDISGPQTSSWDWHCRK